ncbi:hypothetical protein L218DRAFT_667160 [Marasmius fiardii PR-910]|nr:hypothetical protein L218DRAFT_667160 [Marasmius fiardii PR-910]
MPMSIPSPISRLPSELLGQIFTSLRKPTYLLDDSPRPGVTTAALLSTCSQWRDTALSIPTLWAWLVFDYASCSSPLKRDDESRDARIWRRTEQVLARSRNAPLRISIICCWVKEDEDYPPITSRILVALCSRAVQWAELHYSSSEVRLFHHPAFWLAKGHLNSLSYIYFDVDQVEETPQLLTDCPTLRSISLVLHHTQSVQILDISWKQVQNLTVNLFPGSQLILLRVLRKCSNLDSLKLYLKTCARTFVEPGDSSSVVGPVTMIVRSLTLVLFPTFHEYEFFFEKISFSALNSIQIRVPSYLPTTRVDITLFLNLFTRSPSPITFLSIERLEVSEQQWSSLLELMPNLETLEIAEGYGSMGDHKNVICTSQFLNKLFVDADPHSSPPLLPKLRRLVLHPPLVYLTRQ